MNNSNVPSSRVLSAFGVLEKPRLMAGGQGSTFRAGDLIFKQTSMLDETEWAACVYETVTQKGFRIPRYISTISGDWLIEGWFAQQAIAGVHANDRWPEIVNPCRAFHTAFKNVECPRFLNDRIDPWAIADRVAWQDCNRILTLNWRRSFASDQKIVAN